jgi:hypothetical protein
VDILKAVILLIVEALMQALPEILKDKARVVAPDAESDSVRDRVTGAFADFEGVDFDALESSS